MRSSSLSSLGFILTWLLLSACSTLAQSNMTTYSTIKNDEFVTFFHTAAWFSPTDQLWHIPIHGWIYEPQNSTVRKALIAEAMEFAYDLQTDLSTEDNFTRRVNLMIADNERGKKIVIKLGSHNFTLAESKPNGHFQSIVKISAEQAKSISHNGIITFEAIVNPKEKRHFVGQVKLVEPTGISIISDIDDTIKITNVTNHKALFNYTFYQDFEAASGMAQVYDQWAKQGISIHYVTSSPWQLYAPLEEFTQETNFPWATFNMKMVRFRDETLLNLFKKGTETKPKQIISVLKSFPSRKFVLIGDSGEQDPEVYASIMRKYPQQVLKIFIRNVTHATSDDPRFAKVFTDIDPQRWQLFTHPSTLRISD